MAHIAVYLQRTPSGLHPGSALALCWARDIASERGATVTAIALGDGGAWDEATACAASRFGADVLLFGGVDALRNVDARLKPVHLFVPWTHEGMRIAEDLPHLGKPVARWLTERHPSWHGGDAISGIVAGTYPWHDLDDVLEGEYEQDVDRAPLPDFVQGPPPQPFAFAAQGPMSAALDATGMDEKIRERLVRLGATLGEVAAPLERGTVFALHSCPASWSDRSPHCRTVLLPGPDARVERSWLDADWVLPGNVTRVLEQLEKPPWRPEQR